MSEVRPSHDKPAAPVVARLPTAMLEVLRAAEKERRRSWRRAALVGFALAAVPALVSVWIGVAFWPEGAGPATVGALASIAAGTWFFRRSRRTVETRFWQSVHELVMAPLVEAIAPGAHFDPAAGMRLEDLPAAPWGPTSGDDYRSRWLIGGMLEGAAFVTAALDVRGPAPSPPTDHRLPGLASSDGDAPTRFVGFAMAAELGRQPSVGAHGSQSGGGRLLLAPGESEGRSAIAPSDVALPESFGSSVRQLTEGAPGRVWLEMDGGVLRLAVGTDQPEATAFDDSSDARDAGRDLAAWYAALNAMAVFVQRVALDNREAV